MKKAALVLIPFVFVFTSCRFGIEQIFYRQNGEDVRWTDPASQYIELGEIYSTDASSYSFLVFSDAHFGSEKSNGIESLECFLDFYAKANETNESKKLRFAIALGDQTDTGTLSDYLSWQAADMRISSRIAKSNPKASRIFAVMGNHDVFNDGIGNWRAFSYPHFPAYRFTVRTSAGTRSFLSMDSANSCFTTGQLDFFEALLNMDKTRGNRMTVMSHVPLHQFGGLSGSVVCMDEMDRLRAIQLFASTGVDFYLSGHVHCGGTHDFGSFRELNFHSMVESGGKGCFYVVTVDEALRTAQVFKYSTGDWALPQEADVYVF